MSRATKSEVIARLEAEVADARARHERFVAVLARKAARRELTRAALDPGGCASRALDPRHDASQALDPARYASRAVQAPAGPHGERSIQRERSLPLTPLLAAVVATMGSLGTVLCAYATVLGADPAWTTTGLATAVGSLVACFLARRPGAGGRARAKLGGFAYATTLFAAIFLLLGAAMRQALR